MVRGLVTILALVGMFLTACGKHAQNQPVKDNIEAFSDQRGIYTGTGTNYVGEAPEKSKSGTTVETPAVSAPRVNGLSETPIFIGNPNIEVDWASKTVSLSGRLSSQRDGKEVVEDITYQGNFNESTGVAILKPQNNPLVSLALFRCKDQCGKLLVDVSLRDEAHPTVAKRQQVEFVTKPEVAEVEYDEAKLQADLEAAAAAEARAQVEPQSSDLRVQAPAAPVTAAPKVTPAPVAAPVQAIVPPAPEMEFEMDDPGVPSAAPFLITDEMLDHVRAKEELSLDQFQGSELFPINLGSNYTGKALGYYSRKGSIANGNDVIVTAKGSKEDQIAIGYKSVQRSDAIIYGSGLLVKTVEEAGKLFDKKFPGKFFEVNDLSKENGGPIYRKSRNGRWRLAHASHQNGLDMDIRLPKLANGRYDYEKAWTILKSFVSLGHVDVVFLNPTRMKEMCTHLQKSGEKDYQSTFAKLYKESGHSSHMHVRLQCTAHNIGCIAAKYTQSQYGVCK